MTVGEKIKKIRKEKEIRLEDLSIKSGVSLAELSLLENDKIKQPTVKTVLKLAKGLEIEPEELFGLLF